MALYTRRLACMTSAGAEGGGGGHKQSVCVVVVGGGGHRFRQGINDIIIDA